ncbi:MAG: hypothetical protein AABW56_04665 [Nanoarchaeota archaeon]
MESMKLCKGGCGSKALYSGWCGLRWKKGNKISVICPTIEQKRGRSISRYRIKEAKLGLNPMQNPIICKKNHSIVRNRKASETFKKLAKLRLLPQQTESKYKSALRLSRIRKALQKLAAEGKLNHQIESLEKKRLRHKKISATVKALHAKGYYINKGIKKILYKSKFNGKIYFRSGWESEVAKFLDLNNIHWLYEPFPIPYIDDEGNAHITIPDFYLPRYNLIIEVKSGRKDFLRKSNIKNKAKGIKRKGFNFNLWMDKEIEMIRKGNNEFLLENIRNKGEKNA